MNTNNTARRKGGRPKSPPHQLRVITLRIRVSAAELEALQNRANSLGLSVARWLRQAALLRHLPPAPVPEVNRKAYAELAKLAGNLNQLAHAVHTGKAVVSEDLLKETLATLRLLRLGLLGASNDCQTD